MFHRRHGLPDDWLDVVETEVAIWHRLSADERDQVAANADWLLQAGLLVLGLDVDELREVSAVVVYPSAMQSRGERAGPIPGTVTDGPLPILGEAHERRGPVLIAWDEAQAAARATGR